MNRSHFKIGMLLLVVAALCFLVIGLIFHFILVILENEHGLFPLVLTVVLFLICGAIGLLTFFVIENLIGQLGNGNER